MPADVGEEQLQAVCGAGNCLRSLEARSLLLGRLLLGRSGSRRAGVRSGRADLEADALELVRQLLDLLVVQVELDGERLELGRLQIAALLCALDERARLVSLEQLLQRVLGQLSSILSGAASTGSTVLLTLRGNPSDCQRTLQASAIQDFERRFGAAYSAAAGSASCSCSFAGVVRIGKSNSTLPFVVQDEPGPERFVVPGAETGQDFTRLALLEQLPRELRRERAAGDALPDDEAAAGLLAALPARAAVCARVLADDLARLGAAARAQPELDALRAELLLVERLDLLDDLLREVGDLVDERGAVARPVLDVGELLLPRRPSARAR